MSWGKRHPSWEEESFWCNRGREYSKLVERDNVGKQRGVWDGGGGGYGFKTKTK